ncbi:N-acetyltransferase [Aeromicrobium flavum]|uniref:N-acetyltransferase n=1 Tax=Aeromicrobium flavum TaxID=416568 RepID=A0A512HTR3_9ACTN|nr:GNAT family N-acetyltransferase [Aeromicrobium flavum]GEO88790.1 N-acetyltransferase [Aeromicrobium flavum]
MTVEITHHEADGQYEIAVDGETAGHTEARVEGDVVVFPHTVIDERFEGQGLASQLVAHALDDVRSQGKKVRATCSYVKHYIEKHPEYQDLLAG